MPSGPRLVAVPSLGEGSITAAALPHRGRPSDRHETWFVAACVIEELARRAEQACLPLDTSACLLVEHGLLDASATYLRSLAIAGERACPLRPERLRLPSRLTDRILAHHGPEDLLGGDLRQALAWEIAAVRTGATMTEWCLRSVMRA
jgi:hypothetical protein